MSNYYWLKLHFDLLDDWKVGTLPDSLKWRFIQCLLVAGEVGENGWLPPLAQFAFRIRPMTPEALQKDLAHLASSELVELKIDNDGMERWYVTNYEKRQAKKSAAERKRAQRERDRHDTITDMSRDSHGHVTTRDTDKIRIDKIRVDKDQNQNRDARNGDDGGFARVFTEYENNIGQLTPIISGQIEAAVDEFGAQWLIDAIAIAVENNARKWSYINGILKRWRTDGRQEKQAQTAEPENIAGAW